MNLLEQLTGARIVPVVKIEDPDRAVPLAEALRRGGLTLLEVTFRTPRADEAIARIKAAVPDITVIAGTILTPDAARRALRAGAEAIVSPGLTPGLVRWCQRKKVPVCPGIATASELQCARALGLRLVKFFPAEAAGGIRAVKALAAPYGDMRFMPTGGITEDNAADYLAFGSVAACGGSWMATEQLIESGDFDAIERLAASAKKKLVI